MKKTKIFINAQFAIYFSETLDKPEQTLWPALNVCLKKELDQTPIILPVPNEPTLVDVPIVQAVSKNSAFKLNITRRRVDFFIYGQGKKATYQDIQKLLIDLEKNLVKEVNNVVQIKWIGLILNFFIEENNPDVIISKLIDSKFKSLHKGKTLEASVDYIEQIEVLAKKVNNHTQLQAGKAKFKLEKSDTSGILISRDFNTKPEENGNNYVNEEFTKEFIQFVEKNLNLDEIISLLWKQ